MTTHDSDSRSGPLSALIAKWRENADLLADGNKSEFADPAAGMQRACANELAALLSGSDQSDVMAECHKWSSWLVCVDTTTEYRICVRCQQKEFRPRADKPTKAAS